jgi:hypothetical protein
MICQRRGTFLCAYENKSYLRHASFTFTHQIFFYNWYLLEISGIRSKTAELGLDCCTCKITSFRIYFFFKVIFGIFPYGFVFSRGHFKGTQKISSLISNWIYLCPFCPSVMDVFCSQSSGKMPFLSLCKKFAICRTNVPLNVCIISPLSLLAR